MEVVPFGDASFQRALYQQMQLAPRKHSLQVYLRASKNEVSEIFPHVSVTIPRMDHGGPSYALFSLT
jgi:hypothetical protein